MLEWLGINKAAAVAGAIGAALAAAQGQDRTRLERSLNFLVGFGIACYAPDLIIGWFGLKDGPSIYGGMGFFLGYFGMSLTDAVVQAIKALRDTDWKVIINSWLGKK